MASINKCILIGRLGQDPDTKHVQSTSLTTFTLATSETWKDKEGVKKEDTQWHRIVVWGKQGENVAKYCKKGDLVYVEGKIQTDSYEKDGQKLYATKIVAKEVKFMPKGSNEASKQETKKQETAMDDVPF